MRPRHTSSMVGAPGAGEQRASVVAAEQRRREVEHVPVDEALAMERAGDRRAALDHRLDDAAAAELVEHVAERAVELDARMDLARRPARCRARRAAGRRRRRRAR